MSLAKKRLSIIIGIIALIVIGLFFAFCRHGILLRSPIVVLPDPQQVDNADRTNSVQGQDGEYNTLREVSGVGATDSITRDQALQRYAGNVVELDANCRANPSTKVIARDTVLMFDNESKWQRTIIIGPRTYTIEPFDYVLASFGVPGTFAVTCDSIQTVALIAVQ